MTQLFCIILAGGLGSNLWPVSRAASPKQMIKSDENYSLFQQTFLNMANIVNDKDIITAVNVKYVSNIKEQLKELQKKFCRKHSYKIISEPLVKNTAPAVAVAAKYINDNFKYFYKTSPVILVAPSDEIFADRNILAATLEQGINLAKNGYIISFGTKAENIDENMSYFKIKKSNSISKIAPCAFKVSDFINKPSKDDISDIKNTNYFLNTGIYMFDYDTYTAELKKYAKEIYSLITEEKITNSIPSVPLSKYENVTATSFEDVIVSNSKRLAFIELQTNWKDIGNWEAVYKVSKKDEQGNCFLGKVVDMNSENSLVYSTDKLVATMGLKNKTVISTEDAAFICDRNYPEGIQKIYQKLNDKNSQTKEMHKTVYRPWGFYTVLENGEGFLTKCITVNPGAKLSLQKHFHRSEHWIILEGEAVVIKGDEIITLTPGESVDIGIEEIHSLQNNGNEQIKILEVQRGKILDENDIERIEDIYGRV